MSDNSMEIRPKQVEGEVVPKVTTWEDVRQSAREVGKAWDKSVEDLKVALEEAKQKRWQASESNVTKVTVYERGDTITTKEGIFVIEDMYITGAGEIKITGRLKED